MKNAILLLSCLFFFCSTLNVNASEILPKNIKEFNVYLSKVDSSERIDTYTQIIENIDGLISETNGSKLYSKIQKRRMIAQYRLFKNRVQLALRKQQKLTSSNIDFQRMIPKKVTNTGTTNTGIINSNPIIQQSIPQQNTQQANPIINTSTNPVQENTSSLQTNTETTVTTAPSYNSKVVIGSSAIASPDYRNFDASTFEREVGRFSISASDEDFQIKSIKITNLGNLQLSNLFTGNPNIQLVDIERGNPSWRVDCGDIIDGNIIFLQDCSIDPILKGQKRNFKVVIYPQTIDSSVKKNIQLSINSSDISLVRLSDSGAVDMVKIVGSVTMDSYTAEYTPPNVYLSNATSGNNNYQLKLGIFNNSSINVLNLKSFEFELSQSSNLNGQLIGNLCIIINGSTSNCGTGNESANPIQINPTGPITNHLFSLPALIYTSSINPNESKEIYIKIANENIILPYYSSDMNKIEGKIKSIQYNINGLDYDIDLPMSNYTSVVVNQR